MYMGAMMIISRRLILILPVLAIGGAAVCHAKSKLPENTPAPDLTKVVIADLSHTYHLGPTGARGWIHKISSYATPDDFEGYFTNKDARQILVTAVEQGSPADGMLAAGDVILGAGKDPFDMDARKAIADAIDEAETEEHKGVLRLLRWRPDTPDKEDATGRSKGKSEWVELQLKVMGAYSDTAPYECPKSKAIIDQTAALIFNEKRTDRLHIAALGLLATGEERYIAAVRKYIHEKGLANPKMKLSVETAQGSSAWNWSYSAILLGEYYLLTGDKDVLPALETYAVTLAMGQSIAGNWGHKMADYAYNDGKAHGRLTGYGALNVVGLPCFMAMNFAEKCGIRHPELTRAIARSSDFFGYYAGKGTIPYGHHHPLEYMVTNNGMSGSSAITFALQGDTERAGFFSRLSAAAHTKTEVGHTGTFFGTFWTPLGANLAGPDTCAAFFKEHRWIHTLARTWKGGFVYQAPGGRFGGSSESYYGLSSDGAHLIFYATPRRKLVITGRDPNQSIWLMGEEAGEAVAAGVLDYGSRSEAQLLALLEHPVPMVRRKAADALGTRMGDFVGPLRTMLASGSRDARVGAAHGLAALKERAAPAIDDLVAVIGNPKENLWVRNRALFALPSIGKPALGAVEGLLKISLVDKPEDPRGDLDKEIALTVSRLVEDPYQADLDRDLFYPAITKFLDHPHHDTRTAAMKLLHDIPLEDFHLMADEIIHVIRNNDQSYETYHHDAARAAGLAILVRLRIRDGINLCLETIELTTWGQKWRVSGKNGRLATLASYGADAQSVLPQLKEMRANRKLGENVDEFLNAIEQSTETRKLISLDDAIETGRQQATPGAKHAEAD